MQTFTAALESGLTTFCFTQQSKAQEWQQLARVQAMLEQNGCLLEEGSGQQVHSCRADSHRFAGLCASWLVETQVGQVVQLSDAKDIAAAAGLCDAPGFVACRPADWQIIPAENLVAAFQVAYSTL